MSGYRPYTSNPAAAASGRLSTAQRQSYEGVGFQFQGVLVHDLARRSAVLRLGVSARHRFLPSISDALLPYALLCCACLVLSRLG